MVVVGDCGSPAEHHKYMHGPSHSLQSQWHSASLLDVTYPAQIANRYPHHGWQDIHDGAYCIVHFSAQMAPFSTQSQSA